MPTDGTAIFYTDPWQGGESHLRDAVEYMLTASMAVLDWAADRPQELLFNIYRMGRDAIEAGEADDLYAYVIPTEQWDGFEALELVEVLRRWGVEVYRATVPFEAGGEPYAAGAHIIYAAQAFRPRSRTTSKRGERSWPSTRPAILPFGSWDCPCATW